MSVFDHIYYPFHHDHINTPHKHPLITPAHTLASTASYRSLGERCRPTTQYHVSCNEIYRYLSKQNNISDLSSIERT